MIRKMKEEDLQQCAVIYAKAFPIEYWGIDWNPDNAKEYLLDYYEQKRFVGYVYEENDVVIGCIFALCKQILIIITLSLLVFFSLDTVNHK